MKFSKSFQICLFILAGIACFTLNYFPALPTDLAYCQGYRQSKRGDHFSENPYMGMNDMHDLYAAWSDGWIQYQMEIRGNLTR